MKIGFIGNTNNYPFILARTFRRMGHEVIFIVTQVHKLHRPEGRYSDIPTPYPHWIRDVAPMDDSQYVLPNPKRTEMIDLLKACDLVISNHLGHSLLPLIKRPAIALLTGSDLDYYADFRNVDRFNCGLQMEEKTLSREKVLRHLGQKLISQQREGIRSAIAVNYFAWNLMPHGDTLLREIGVANDRRIFFMMSEVQEIAFTPPPHHSPTRVFCATRLTWKKPMISGTTELDYKGSDVMIRGLGQYYRNTGVPLNIRLVKKGFHINETMDLIAEEGLTEQVTWLEELTQQEVAREFQEADLVFEQLGQSLVGMAGFDAMATGRPVIANGRPEIFQPILGEVSPICQARTPEEVCTQLKRLVSDPTLRHQIGTASRAYMEKFFHPEAAARLCLAQLTPQKTYLRHSLMAVRHKPSLSPHEIKISPDFIQWIRNKTGNQHFDLHREEVDFFKEIVRRFPVGAEWGISPQEGLLLFSMAAAIRPHLAVEVGTCSGISTSYLLGGMKRAYEMRKKMDPGRSVALHAFDIAEYCYPTPTKPVGYAIAEMIPEMLSAVRIHVPKKACDVKEFCSPSSIQLAFIDANHDHPMPLLDLIDLLPCLQGNAWILLHDLNLPKFLYARGDERIANHGAHWLYQLWPGDKFSIGGDLDNLGAIQLPGNIAQLLPMTERLLQFPQEWNVPEEELERAVDSLHAYCLNESPVSV